MAEGRYYIMSKHSKHLTGDFRLAACNAKNPKELTFDPDETTCVRCNLKNFLPEKKASLCLTMVAVGTPAAMVGARKIFPIAVEELRRMFQLRQTQVENLDEMLSKIEAIEKKLNEEPKPAAEGVGFVVHG